MLTEFQKAFINKNMRKSYAEKDLIIECAGDFGRLIASAEKDGLAVPVAIEMARNHFKIYGKAMMDFAELVTVEMVRPIVERVPTQPASEGVKK